MRTLLYLAAIAGLMGCVPALAGSAPHKGGTSHAKQAAPVVQAAPSPPADSLVIVSDRDYVAPTTPVVTQPASTGGSTAIPAPRIPNTAIPQETWSTSSAWFRASYEAWAKRAGYRVIWQFNSDRPLPAAVQTHGTFSDATTQLLKLYHHVKDPKTGRYFPSIYADIYVRQRLVILTENN